MRRREALWFYIIILPWVIGFFIFTAGPMIYSFYLSFTDWDLFTPAQYVGLDNYERLFTHDEMFRTSVYNTFYYALISVPLNLVVSLFLAYLLNRPLRGMRLYRTMYYIPSVVPIVAVTLLFKWVMAPDTGLINRALGVIGIDGPAWLLDPAWVKPALIIMSMWALGSSLVFLLAGMQGIPEELYEAAAIDGANQGQQFFKVTLPMLSPVIFFNLIMGIIGSLQTFSQVYILTSSTGGSPQKATIMMVPYLFRHAFRNYRMGYASSVAWLLFAIILILTLVVIRSSSAWVYYESEVKRA